MCSHVQGEHDRLTSSIQELDTKLAKMTTHNETLERQYDEKAKMCRLMEVLSSLQHLHDMYYV